MGGQTPLGDCYGLYCEPLESIVEVLTPSEMAWEVGL
jgi:hypothetical protein